MPACSLMPSLFDLVDIRKFKPKNFVTGRWVLTVKRDRDGKFQKCKARWALRPRDGHLHDRGAFETPDKEPCRWQFVWVSRGRGGQMSTFKAM